MNEDYIDEATGLLYCGKCHTPKERAFPVEFMGMKKHPVLCACAAAEQKKLEQERRQRELADRVETLRREAFREIPAGEWRFEKVTGTPALQKVRRYADCWEEMRADGIGLLLFGSVGTGKSYAAGCLANALLDGGHSVRFVGLSDVVNRMQGLSGGERESYLSTLMKPELLILDDLGAERSTSFGREQVFDVINKRTLSGKPLVVTTNLPVGLMQQAEEIQERRIYDRILEVCVPVRFEGESFRRAGATENLRKASSILAGHSGQERA